MRAASRATPPQSRSAARFARTRSTAVAAALRPCRRRSRCTQSKSIGAQRARAAARSRARCDRRAMSFSVRTTLGGATRPTRSPLPRTHATRGAEGPWRHRAAQACRHQLEQQRGVVTRCRGRRTPIASRVLLAKLVARHLQEAVDSDAFGHRWSNGSSCRGCSSDKSVRLRGRAGLNVHARL